MRYFDVETGDEFATLLARVQGEMSSDGNLVFDAEGKIVHFDSQFARMWSLRLDSLERSDDDGLLRAVAGTVKEPEVFQAKLRPLLSDLEEVSHDELELTDGRVFDVASAPLIDAQGLYHGRTWRFRDVTEVRRTRHDLASVSKDCQRADVAMDVLSDVAEVLNQLNVTIGLLRAKVLNSKSESLSRLDVLLRGHRSDLAKFVTEDPRGREIPQLVAVLSDALSKERSKMLDWVRDLESSVDRVKGIVHVQQSFRGRGGVREVCDLVEIIEDAMKIESAGGRCHDLAFTIEMGRMPEVEVDRQSVVQILVELLANARQAAVEGPAQEPQIIIRVQLAAPEMVRIEVQDNGVGITHQNLQRVFQYGYTTRDGSKGYGLHSALESSNGLGGSLSASSGGLDHGACFAVEIPVGLATLADSLSAERSGESESDLTGSRFYPGS